MVYVRASLATFSSIILSFYQYHTPLWESVNDKSANRFFLLIGRLFLEPSSAIQKFMVHTILLLSRLYFLMISASLFSPIFSICKIFRNYVIISRHLNCPKPSNRIVGSSLFVKNAIRLLFFDFLSSTSFFFFLCLKIFEIRLS